MIDHLLGRPSASWKRTQVVLVVLFWAWRLRAGDPRAAPLSSPHSLPLARFTPWQIIIALMTCMYGVRHCDTLLGLHRQPNSFLTWAWKSLTCRLRVTAPEPLAHLYSRGFYRATWLNTALDAGFATAASIRIKWLRDLLSIVFAGYYLVYASEADEKLRKYRAIPTVEILRATWEKASNPIIHFFTRRNRLEMSIRRKFILPRPTGSKYTKPIACWLYFARPELDLVRCKNLVLDVPGGGFIAMSPLHHEDRLRRWAIKTGMPILSIDYCKAPEYPFPYAIHECMDVYRLIQETKGRVIGMGQDVVNVVVTGDSAGANLSAAMMISMLESTPDSPFFSLPQPVGALWMYAALDFNFTSWMSKENLRILRDDQSVASLPGGILESKNHLDHRSPLSVVADRPKFSSTQEGRRHSRHNSLAKSFANLPRKFSTLALSALTSKLERRKSDVELRISQPAEQTSLSDSENSDTYLPPMSREKSLSERVVYHEEDSPGRSSDTEDEPGPESSFKSKAAKKGKNKKAFGTRLTMTSRTGFFNDQIISPSMMRCMAICYVGPRNAPDLTKDHHISPIFTPPSVLARFPPIYFVCGEKDPFVDDTVIMAGKIREAKRARKKEALNKRLENVELYRKSRAIERDHILDEREGDWVQMRIFEGWSHGFAQMLPLLPEVSSVLDLTADFITTAFTKHEIKSQGGLKPPPPMKSAYRFPAAHHSDTNTAADDEPLSFVPRRKPRTGSDSRSASPIPQTIPGELSRASSSLRNTTSSPSSGLRVTTDTASSSPDACTSDNTGPVPMSARTLIGFNVLSAAAIVAPPILDQARTVGKLAGKKEGNILDNHQELFDRRRKEAGYGLPEMATPEDHFKPLAELSAPSLLCDKRVGMKEEAVLNGQFVGEEDLLERRRLDVTYGLLPHLESPEEELENNQNNLM